MAMRRVCSPRARWSWVLLPGLIALTAGALALVIADLIEHPRDLWAAGMFAAGSLVGWSWDRYGP
jgi:hypothetical protein